MARKITQGPSFVPEEFRSGERGYVPRRVYGIVFTQAETRAVWAAVATAAGCSPKNVVSTLLGSAMRQCGQKHGIPYCYTYSDDALVYLCEEFGIDVNQFPHNTPKLPVDAFVARAKMTFVSLPLPRNEMQWQAQRNKWIDLWFGWVAEQCERGGCEEESHHWCEDLYIRPNFWTLAQALDSDRRDKEKLMASIDATPSRRARSAAGAALARISVASGRARP